MSPSSANFFPLTTFALFVLLLALHGMTQAQSGGNRRMLGEEYLHRLNKRSPMKKSDGLSDFVGSLNGAARLRYGKRSESEGSPAEEMEDISPQFFWAVRSSNGRWKLAKRASNYAEALPAGLLDQLNGAERLRFGRK
ncbi:hypothetical protein GPALN_005439 [Globodera pallida]|nr:hypothetical protein GPALN_005439 [Globodera pallida]